MCVPHVYQCPWRPEGSLSSSEAVFMEDYELPDVCAGNWLWMLWKSQLQSPLSKWASLRPQQVSFIKPSLFPSSPFSFSFIWGKYLLFFWVDYLLASISKNWIFYIASSCYFHRGLSFLVFRLGLRCPCSPSDHSSIPTFIFAFFLFPTFLNYLLLFLESIYARSLSTGLWQLKMLVLLPLGNS